LARRGVPIIIAGASLASVGAAAQRGRHGVAVLEVRAEIAPTLLVQSAYHMIAALSVRHGFDPDRPAHLRKITETV
jgi:glucosamine--fructose-6-phosphate aminotransferase (isomerizing)